jgi:pimeloyl-ACP methyl ester carboxylesterase
VQPPFKLKHKGVTKKLYGEKALSYWLYQPADPAPASAPVILFLHGWNGKDPYYYGGWIEHLVKSGKIVIYPVFQTSILDSPDEMMENAIQGTKDAIARLQMPDQVRPELDKFAIVGHSLGGGLTAKIAARAEQAALPAPKALMLVQPGWKGSDQMPLDDLSRIPSSVLMLIVEGDEDQFRDTRQGGNIFCRTTQIAADRKRYLMLRSNSHKDPPLIADHSSPLSPQEDYLADGPGTNKKWRARVVQLLGMREGETDELDYYGYWKLFDALLEAANGGQKITAVSDIQGSEYVQPVEVKCP